MCPFFIDSVKPYLFCRYAEFITSGLGHILGKLTDISSYSICSLICGFGEGYKEVPQLTDVSAWREVVFWQFAVSGMHALVDKMVVPDFVWSVVGPSQQVLVVTALDFEGHHKLLQLALQKEKTNRRECHMKDSLYSLAGSWALPSQDVLDIW